MNPFQESILTFIFTHNRKLHFQTETPKASCYKIQIDDKFSASLHISMHVSIFKNTCVLTFWYSTILYVLVFSLLAFSRFSLHLERGRRPLNFCVTHIIHGEITLKMWQAIDTFVEKQQFHSGVKIF